MSQQNSDPLFDSVEFGGPLQMPAEMPPPGVASTPQRTAQSEVHGFTIYTVILILSFLMLTTAAILLFVDAGKYL